MDKKALAIGGFSALLLASTAANDAALAAQKVTAPANTAGAISIQRSKSIGQASPAAINKLNKNAYESHPWLEHWAQAHTTKTNPVGNVQKALQRR